MALASGTVTHSSVNTQARLQAAVAVETQWAGLIAEQPRPPRQTRALSFHWMAAGDLKRTGEWEGSCRQTSKGAPDWSDKCVLLYCHQCASLNLTSHHHLWWFSLLSALFSPAANQLQPVTLATTGQLSFFWIMSLSGSINLEESTTALYKCGDECLGVKV